MAKLTSYEPIPEIDMSDDGPSIAMGSQIDIDNHNHETSKDNLDSFIHSVLNPKDDKENIEKTKMMKLLTLLKMIQEGDF